MSNITTFSGNYSVTGFEVTLKFSGVPKYLKMPYSAISRFHDPSVGFHLQFEQDPAEDEIDTPPPEKPKTAAGGKAGKSDKKAPGGDGAEVVSLDSFRKK